MSRDSLTKAITDAKFNYYESIAKLIVDNPTVSLAALRQQHRITHHDMWTAQKMFHVRRKTGRGSQAYKASKGGIKN
jgi:hypothetical protein